MIASLKSPVPPLSQSPQLTAVRVEHDHFKEWRASGVDPAIITLNVETLHDTAIDPNAESLFPIAERLNWKITRFGYKTRPRMRGWWVSGLDPLNDWQRMSWGRFKPDPDTPVLDRENGKPAKYLSPKLGDNSSRLVLLEIPNRIWKKISERYDVPITSADQEQGFWHWVYSHNIPVILTEGEKKAGCLLSIGYAAIALPGIYNGYRKETQRLTAELEFFATLGRQFRICFDFETKPKTLNDIYISTSKLGKLLKRQGCNVQVICLPGPDKGVDDFIVAQGAEAFPPLYHEALDHDLWQATKLWSLTLPPALSLNQRYLGALPFPHSGLCGIKSPKGSGKTQSLEPTVRDALQQGRKVLVLTHRVQLGRAICDRLGLDWVEDMRDSETAGLLGFGLCVDSLHFKSQARFNPQQWKGAILIIDEAEQVLWHLLNSTTCYEQRVQILDTFRELVQLIATTNGLIIAQDADLSDLSIDYLRSLADVPLTPWVVINDWQPEPENSCQTFFYDTPTPAPLLSKLDDLLTEGAVFVCLDSQKAKGKYSSVNLEALYRQRCPELRILRIDSQTVADPSHPAYRIVERLNQELPNYDLVIATPTIGTGVDLYLRDHFVAVVGIFQGAIPDAEARQALARVRESVPRYVWARGFGPGKVGNGSCNYRAVAKSKKKEVEYNLRLLLNQDFDLDEAHDPITLRTWAKMAARVNVSMWSYRRELREGLVREGHQLSIVTDDINTIVSQPVQELIQELSTLFPAKEVLADLVDDLNRGALQFPGFEYLPFQHPVATMQKAEEDLVMVRDLNRLTEAIAVVNAPDISESEYQQLHDKRSKTPEEHHAERKHELLRRYPIPITAELKLKDDEGWFPRIRLHYFLMYNPQLVRNRDLKEWEAHLERGSGKVALQDVKLLTAQVELLRGLGVPELLNPDRKVRATDADVERLALLCWRCPQDIKAVLNLTITEAITPIQIVQALLSKLGLKLTCIGRDQTDDGRRGGIRVYQYQSIDDERGTIFAEWQQRDVSQEESPATEDHGLDQPGGDDPPADIRD
jgi:Domain of unknown function (DUF3854)